MTYNLRLVPGIALGAYLMSGMDYEDDDGDEELRNTQVLTLHLVCLCFDIMWVTK